MGKTCLILSYIFPPSRFCDIAGQRPWKFAQYLANFGWKVLVVTRIWDELSSISPFLIPRDSPKVKNWFRNPFSTSYSPADGITVYPVPFSLQWRRQVDLWLKSNNARLMVPVRKAVSLGQLVNRQFTGSNWHKQAEFVVDEIVKTQKIDCILATAPPPCTLQLAARLGLKYSMPWVADLRDRSVDCFPKNMLLQYNLQSMMKTIRSAAAVVTVTEELANQEKYRLKLRQNPICITNGFDPTEFEADNFLGTEFTVVYTGTLYPVRRDPTVFIKGLQIFAKNIDWNRGPIFHYYGTSGEMVSSIARDLKVEHLVKIGGHVTRQESLRLQQSAAILLHVTECSGNKGIATGKIFEYFGAARPILASPGDESTGDQLIISTNTGVIAHTPEMVADYLEASFCHWKKFGQVKYNPCMEIVDQYSRVNQARRMAGLLDEIACCLPS
jgi:hypothetical protein